MPTATYMNLSGDKKERVFNAAVEEFSRFPFGRASITRIVKDADIPRGSFYQYFENKEDLYLYILTEIGKEKMAAIADSPPPADADFFDNMKHMAGTAMRWAGSHPTYNRIAMLMDLDDSTFIEKLKERNRESLKTLEAMIVRDQDQGRIRKDLNPSFLLDVVYTLLYKRISDLYQNRLSEEGLLKEVDALTDLLRRGAAHEHSER